MKEPQQYEREKLAGMTIPELVGVILRQQEWAQQMYEEVEKAKSDQQSKQQRLIKTTIK
jgi:hypothetical protein